jgi:hypothetical protein
MKQIFPIVPGSNGPFYMMGGLSLFMIALIIFFMYIAYSSRNTKFELSPEGIRIRGDIYGRLIRMEKLLADEAKAVRLSEDSEYRLSWSSNGSRMPGYKAGWFRLRNRKKALVFVTDPNRVVYIPTRDGYSLMLSVADPEVFIEALKRTARKI